MAATDTNTVTLSIDGRELTVPKGTPLVIAAAEAGIEIPIFCYEPRLGPPVGACRMCLVEIEGMPKLQAACTMVATDGMNVLTRSQKAASGQAAVLEFILLNHPLDCPVCDKGGVQGVLSRNHPGVDEGWLCDKGRFAYQRLRAADRYSGPLLRGDRGLDDASYPEVVESIARRLRHYVNLYGPDSVAVVSSG